MIIIVIVIVFVIDYEYYCVSIITHFLFSPSRVSNCSKKAPKATKENFSTVEER